MEFLNPNKEKQVRLVFIIVSIVIPVVVAALFKISIEGVDLSFLPPFYAGLNAATAILLISALMAIKKQNQKLHRLLMRLPCYCPCCFWYVMLPIISPLHQQSLEMPIIMKN